MAGTGGGAVGPGGNVGVGGGPGGPSSIARSGVILLRAQGGNGGGSTGGSGGSGGGPGYRQL